MKRDVDFARQLLIDIENRGPDCAISALRPGATAELYDQMNYHIRLLLDAGFVKEVERTAGGSACLRLTNAGHEFIELSHSETRWREAKWIVQQRTGGVSLAVLRGLLTRWAIDTAAYGSAPRPRAYYYEPARTRDLPPAPIPSPEPTARTTADEAPEPTYYPRAAYVERFDWPGEPADWRYAPRVVRGERLPRDWETYDENGEALPLHVI